MIPEEMSMKLNITPRLMRIRCGGAMTRVFIARVGEKGPGAPPSARRWRRSATPLSASRGLPVTFPL